MPDSVAFRSQLSRMPGVCARTAWRNGATAVLFLTVSGLLVGCPPPGTTGMPPFDTTGSYAGTYSTDGSKQFGGAEDCTMTLELVQIVGIPSIAYTFAGVAQMDWDCILPPLVRTSLGIEAEVLTLPVFARLDDEGDFTLDIDLDGTNIPPALRALIDDSEVDTDIPLQSFSLLFTGTGLDADDDGFMDSCMGTVDLSFTYEDEGTQTVELGGTFDVMRTGT